MKKLLLLLLISSTCYSQSSEMSNLLIQTRKIVSDSIIRNTDSVYFSRFKSPAGRINTLKTSTINTNSIVGLQSNFNQGTFTSLFINSFSQLANFSGNNGTVNSLNIQSTLNANPLFVNQDGLVTKESKSQFMSIPAAAFTPEDISPLTAPQSNFSIGGIRRIVNNGEVEGQALANDHVFRLVAPITFPLNTVDQNIILKNAKICTFDKENQRDLVAIIYEVNSSIGQFPLLVNPKMVLRSSSNNSTYQCFDIKANGVGAPFNINSQDNSYYVSVFPINSTISASDILASPNTYILPWRATDNPFLRLVHFIAEYTYE